MGAKSGLTLKVIQWLNRGVQFACSALILGLNSYFLAAMASHDLGIPTSIRAVEGITGVGVVYTALGVVLVCCLAGVLLTSFLAIVLDVAFVGAFIYVATVYKDGAGSCSGASVGTVFGTGDSAVRVSSDRDDGVPLPKYGTACRMGSANLAVAIVAIVFFVLSAGTELALGRHRKKAQRFGPSPANNYTSGYGGGGFLGGLFRRHREAETAEDPNALPLHTEPDQLRQSYGTDAEAAAGSDKYSDVAYSEHTAGVAVAYRSPPPPPPMVGVTTNGFGIVPGHGPPKGRYADGSYNM